MKRALEIVALAALVAMFAGLIWSYAQLPPDIPNHVNTGPVRRATMGKGILWVFPIWSTMLYVILSAMSRMKRNPSRVEDSVVLPAVKAAIMSATSIAYLLWIRQALAA